FQGKRKTLIKEYGDIKIYKVEGEELLFYTTKTPTPKLTERQIMTTLREAATRLIAVQPYEIRDPIQRYNIYKNKILDIIDAAPELGIPHTKREYYADFVVKEMIGYGKLEPLVLDDKLEEIMIIGPKKPVYVFHRDYEMMKTNVIFYDDKGITDIIDKIARQVGRRVDLSQPLLDARLQDGSRVNATIPPVSLDGATMTIRKFRKDPYTIIDLLNFKTMTPELAGFFWLAQDGMDVRPANIIIAGGTGSGKTTLLNVLSSLIPVTERVLTIEQVAELQIPLDHVIRFETRAPGLEGRGEINMDALVVNSLRMRPDRIVVGEVRGPEAASLLTAMNTGHDGSIGTVHANSARETRVRLTSAPMNVPELMLSGLDLIIVASRLHERKLGTIRRVIEVGEVVGVLEGKARIETIYKWVPGKDKIIRTTVQSKYLQMLSDYTGLTRAQLNDEIKERSLFLKKLQDEGIRDYHAVAQALKAYRAAKNKD
ncbi:MAG: CpaF family protein, partial [Candidatus Diapherotrites archaeon]|nr:CpaF family protein [Candidatus Diapherotrites archaeon]